MAQLHLSRPARADLASILITSLEHAYDNGVSLRLEAFRKNYDRVSPRFENLLNTFVLLPELKSDRIRIAPDHAKVTGMEITVRRDSDGPLQWWLSYTRSSAKDGFDDVMTPRVRCTGIHRDESAEDVLRLSRRTGHSRQEQRLRVRQ